MQHLIKIALLFVFTTNCFAQANTERLNFVGKWNLTDYSNNRSEFILSSDKYVSMTINGEFVDGKKFNVSGEKSDGQKGELKFSINYEKNPIEIDFIAIKDGEEKGRILGAIKPLNENYS